RPHPGCLTCIDRANYAAAAAQFPTHAAVRILDGQHASIGRITPQQLHTSSVHAAYYLYLP
ncbi:hypothetical protein, partial [Paenibacillus alvei]|uniref:hypothetical protein n=1 Tax=Paenibacillus alvei TaxID=44250 RepID=UPI0019D5DA60